jgi:hypothetical protein
VVFPETGDTLYRLELASRVGEFAERSSRKRCCVGRCPKNLVELIVNGCARLSRPAHSVRSGPAACGSARGRVELRAK